MATLPDTLLAFVDEVERLINLATLPKEKNAILVSGATDFPDTPTASAAFISDVTTYIQSASPSPTKMAILMATVNRTYLDGVHADILAGNNTPQEIATMLTAATLSVNAEVDALNQIYIDLVDGFIVADSLTPEELVLMVKALPVLQEQIDNKKLMVGLATATSNVIIEQKEELSRQTGPLLPFNPVGEVQFVIAYNDYINYCINFFDGIRKRMYIATLVHEGGPTNYAPLKFGYYSENNIYTVLRENILSFINSIYVGAFILPISTSSIDSTIEVCMVFYYDVQVVFFTEDVPGTLNTYTAYLPRTYLVLDKVKKAVIFMPDATSAARLYADGSTEIVTDYTVTDTTTFQAAFWNSAGFLQLRGTDTPLWNWGTYNIDPTNMGTRTYDLLSSRYFSHQGSIAAYPYQIPYINIDANATVGYNTIQFYPDADLTYRDASTYGVIYKGNNCFVFDEDNNLLSKFYIKIPVFLRAGYLSPTVYFNEPICFNTNNNSVVCRTALANTFLDSGFCTFIQLFY